MRTLIVLGTLEAGGVISKGIGARWASFQDSLVFEGTEKAWRAVETFD